MSENKQIANFIKNICEQNFADAEITLHDIVDLKIKSRMDKIPSNDKEENNNEGA